jgi:hypothetical protein
MVLRDYEKKETALRIKVELYQKNRDKKRHGTQLICFRGTAKNLFTRISEPTPIGREHLHLVISRD